MHPARLIREPLHYLACRNCINVNLLTGPGRRGATSLWAVPESADSGTAGRLARIRARLAPACGGRGSVRGAFGNVRSGNAADQAIDEAFAAAPYLLGPRELLDVGAHQGAAAQRDGHRIRIGCLVELA